MTITKDKLVQSVQNKLAIRANKGIIKYGNTMVEVDMDDASSLKNLQEELLDACVYIEKFLWNKKTTSIN